MGEAVKTVRRREQIDARGIAKAQAEVAKKGIRLVLADSVCGGLTLTVGRLRSTYAVAARRPGTDPTTLARWPQKWHAIGDASEITIEQARSAAAGVKEAVAKGGDPTQERKQAIAEARAEMVASKDAAKRRVMEEQDEAARIASAIAAAMDPAVPVVGSFAPLAHATLDECRRAWLIRRLPTLPSGAGAKKNLCGGLNWVMNVADPKDKLASRAAPPMVDATGAPIGKLRPGELQKEFITAHLTALASRPVLANNRLLALRSLYKWLVEVGAVTVDPTQGVKMLAPPPPREGKTSAAMFRDLWNAAEQIGGHHGSLLKISILLPGLRRQSVAEIRVGWLDIRDGSPRGDLTLPASKSKNARQQVFPIVGDALAIFKELLQEAHKAGKGDDALLFDLTVKGSVYNDWSRITEKIEEIINAKTVAAAAKEKGRPLTAAERKTLRATDGWKTLHRHDFRRAFATELGRHQVGDGILVEELLGHGGVLSRGAAAHYHQGSRVERKTPIMVTWDRLIQHAVKTGKWPSPEEFAAITAGNVVPLHQRTA